jgi:hypothetical protein
VGRQVGVSHAPLLHVATFVGENLFKRVPQLNKRVPPSGVPAPFVSLFTLAVVKSDIQGAAMQVGASQLPLVHVATDEGTNELVQENV